MTTINTSSNHQPKKRKVVSRRSYDEHNDDEDDFFGAGVEAQENLKKWWMETRQFEEPPSLYDFLVNGMGVGPKRVNDFLENVLKDSYSEENTQGDGYFHYMALHCTKRTRGTNENPPPPPQPSSSSATTTEDQEEDLDPLLMVFENAAKVLSDNADPEEDTWHVPQEPYFPPENDLLALVGKTKQKNWDTILNDSLRYNFSAEFLKSLFDKVPANALDKLSLHSYDCATLFDVEGPRYSMDMDCALAIEKVLPKINKLHLGLQKWTKNAFAYVMSILLQTTSLQSVNVHIPSHFIIRNYNTDDDERSNGDYSSFLQKFPAGQVPLCGIQKFKFHVIRVTDLIGRDDTEVEAWPESSLLVLGCISQMPLLETLEVGLGNLQISLAVPSILQAMQSPRLSHLIIYGLTRTDHNSKHALVKILKALQHNCSLLSFQYTELWRIPGLRLDRKEYFQFGLYDETLLNVLRKDNTSLVKLEVGFKDEACERFQECWRPATTTSEKIHYYIDLNKHGRSSARNPETKLEDFVGLLCSVYDANDDDDDDDDGEDHDDDNDDDNDDDVDEDDDDDDDDGDHDDGDHDIMNHQMGEEGNQQQCLKLRYFNIIYGLLRELPGTWSVHAAR